MPYVCLIKLLNRIYDKCHSSFGKNEVKSIFHLNSNSERAHNFPFCFLFFDWRKEFYFNIYLLVGWSHIWFGWQSMFSGKYKIHLNDRNGGIISSGFYKVMMTALRNYFSIIYLRPVVWLPHVTHFLCFGHWPSFRLLCVTSLWRD